MAISPLDRQGILETIRSWSPEEQRALVREIEAGLSRPPSTSLPASQRLSVYDLAGIGVRPGQEPPADEQIAQWLDERRMKESE